MFDATDKPNIYNSAAINTPYVITPEKQIEQLLDILMFRTFIVNYIIFEHIERSQLYG